MGDHTHHIHWAYAGDDYLPPGAALVPTGGGPIEPVFTPEQWSAMRDKS